MTDRLSNTELKRVKQQICEFIITIYYSLVYIGQMPPFPLNAVIRAWLAGVP